MVGITSFGAYVPFYRLAQKEIARAWGGRAGDGERAVANVDEDSVTMAVEAATDALRGRDGRHVDGLIFASTTSPYVEKQMSALIATAIDLRHDVRTSDAANSLRAGTSAVRAALDSVQAGSSSNVIVAASDTRMAIPRSANERIFGDAAAAVEIGSEGVIARLVAAHSTVDEVNDSWRRERDPFVSGWEERFAVTQGYQRTVTRAVSEVFERTGIGPSQLSKAAFYAPDPGSLAAVAKALGLKAEQIPDHHFNSIGVSGTAMPLLVLSSALETAAPGEKILVAGYGSGCDVLIFETTETIKQAPRTGHRGTAGFLASKRPLKSYETFAKFRDLIETESARRQAPSSSATQTWRERDDIYRFYGYKCHGCDTLQYPRQRVCIRCRLKDSFDPVRLSDKRGKLFTFTHDFLNADPDPPTVMSVVDFDGGGRAYLMMTDRDPEHVHIDQDVEMTFRRLYDADGLYNYYWKCRPIR